MGKAVTTLKGNHLVNSLIKPLIMKDVNLLSPRIWTPMDGRPTKYTSEQIRNGFENTDWSNMNLYLDHEDSKGPAVAYWVGFIKNTKIVGEDLIGDLEIWHPLISMFIKDAKAKFAVSVTTNGREIFNYDEDYNDYEITSFQSGSIVDKPGCTESWLPKMLASGKEKGDKTVTGGFVEVINLKSLSEGESEIVSEENKKIIFREGTTVKLDGVPFKLNSDMVVETIGSNLELIKEEVIEEKKELSDINITEKEVKKMEEENKKLEESNEEVKEDESKEVEVESNGVKELSSKVDKLSESLAKALEGMTALTGMVQKSLSEGEEKKEVEEPIVEVKAPEEVKEEESEVKNELEEVKKELAAFKEEANAPDRKSLALGDSATEEVDSNQGMLNFLGSKMQKW